MCATLREHTQIILPILASLTTGISRTILHWLH